MTPARSCNMEELSPMGTSMSEHTRAERLPTGDLMPATELPRLDVSTDTQQGPAFRPATDEPQTADQRLPLFVILLASFFLFGVGAGWQPAESNGEPVSPQLVAERPTAEAAEAAPDSTAAPRGKTTIP